jgi:hypothetical protein
MAAEQKTVQTYLTEMLLDNTSQDNEMLDILHFVRDNGVPLTSEQARGMFLLQEFGMADIANYVKNVRTLLTPFKKILDMVSKLTLADRIKGNAKLSGILKANANPANGLNVDKALGKEK